MKLRLLCNQESDPNTVQWVAPVDAGGRWHVVAWASHFGDQFAEANVTTLCVRRFSIPLSHTVLEAPPAETENACVYCCVRAVTLAINGAGLQDTAP